MLPNRRQNAKNWLLTALLTGAAISGAGSIAQAMSCKASLTKSSETTDLASAKHEAKARYTRKGLNEFMFSRLSSFKKGDRILFVGAGGNIDADLRQFLRAKGLSETEVNSSITTVDIDPSMKPDLVADLSQRGALPPNSAEWVVMMEVIYAVSNPHMAFQEAFAALKPGGQLIFSNMYAMPVEGSYHVGNYTDHELKRMAEAAGFSQVKVSPRNNWAEAIGGLITRLLRDPDPELQQFAQDYMTSDFARKAESLAAQRPSQVPITSGWYGSAQKP